MPTVLITGGHNGLGLDCSKALAAAGHNLVLAGRDAGRVQRAVDDLRAQYPVKVEPLSLDLGSLASVRAAAEQLRGLLKHGDSLQAILCNAGAQFRGPISFSADGYEETFAINCLGHFLLINLVVDLLAEGGRVVFTASGTHDPDTMDGKSVGGAVEPDANRLASEGKQGRRPLSGGVRYATSKLCTVLYAHELDRKLRAAGSSLVAIAYDPGFIPETGLARTAPKAAQWVIRTGLVKGILGSLGVTLGSLPFSGEALARLATDPAYANASGHYFQSNCGKLRERRSSKMSYDEIRAINLWRESAQLVHLKPEERPTRFA